MLCIFFFKFNKSLSAFGYVFFHYTLVWRINFFFFIYMKRHIKPLIKNQKFGLIHLKELKRCIHLLFVYFFWFVALLVSDRFIFLCWIQNYFYFVDYSNIFFYVEILFSLLSKVVPTFIFVCLKILLKNILDKFIENFRNLCAKNICDWFSMISCSITVPTEPISNQMQATGSGTWLA